MKLVITIDTEEDNWGQFQSTGATVDNICQVQSMQELFDEFSAIPTYLVTYPVAIDPRAVSILKCILDRGRCEIGAHCHPWNTPPFEEDCNESNSMICNLPDQLQYKKLESLHETIRRNFGVDPVSFRAGRWGFSDQVARNLIKLGYKIDSSVTPYTDWRVYNGVDYSNRSPRPYPIKWSGGSDSGDSHDLIELPASVGFLQKNFSVCNRMLEVMKQKPLSSLRLAGLLQRLRLLNKVYLSPELADSRNMIMLAQRLTKSRYNILNMFFHSPSLQAGLSPYVKTSEDKKQFLKRVREFLAYAKNSGIESVRLSEMPQYLAQTLAGPIHIH